MKTKACRLSVAADMTEANEPVINSLCDMHTRTGVFGEVVTVSA